MQFIKQDDYDSFVCVADQCKESCCTLWQIVIDEESATRYKNYQGSVKERLLDGLIEDDGDLCFAQQKRRCKMLDEDGLCYLQRNEGESFLCQTCKMFPRHTEEFEGVRELTLSLSCPEVARMILSKNESMQFISYEAPSPEDDEFFENFDYLLYTKLVDAREVILKIAQDRGQSLECRFQCLNALTLTLQESLDDEQIFAMDDVLAKYDEKAAWPLDTAEDFSITFDEERQCFSKLYELEFLHDDWSEQIEAVWEQIFKDEAAWKNAQEQMEAFSVPLEHIMVVFIFTYFCGAVYDDMIYAKMALTIFSTRWIFYFALSLQKRHDVDIHEALIDATYLYAKEIEHSDLNLNDLEDWFDGRRIKNERS